MDLPNSLTNRSFTNAMALEHGLTAWDLRRMAELHQIQRLTRGVYAHGTAAEDLQQRALSVGGALPPNHVLCDRTAGWVEGVDTYSYPGESGDAKIETTAMAGSTRTRRRECIGTSRTLLPGDVVWIAGVPVTAPARTALDLACKMKPMSALASMEAFLRTGVADRAEIVAMLPRYRGRRGVRLAREVVEIASGVVESEGESFTKMVIHRAGLPLPAPQVWLTREDGSRIRLDFAYEGLKVAVEYDGEQFHGPDRRESDERRRAWLRRHGWHVIVVRRTDLSGARSQVWIEELRRVLIERSRGLEHYSRFWRAS